MSCITSLYAELFGASAVPDAAAFARLREQLAASPAHWAFVARDAGPEPLAFFTLGESFAVFADGRYGILNELWGRPDARSAGAGAQIIEQVRVIARQRGGRRVDVSAPQDPKWDRSEAFYLRLGFTRTGRKLERMVDTTA